MKKDDVLTILRKYVPPLTNTDIEKISEEIIELAEKEAEKTEQAKRGTLKTAVSETEAKVIKKRGNKRDPWLP